MEPYATHIEPLINAALETEGDILELGCGDYSTPILSAIAHHRGNRFVINSSDPEWANRFRNYGDVEIVDWNTWTPSGNWGLIMLDNEQLTCDRIKWIPQLAKICKKIVMHDADAARLAEDYQTLTAGLNSCIYAKHTPWTEIFTC